jgi:hypothetical protein
MTPVPGGTRFRYDYVIPEPATAVDFVFNNGAGTWDNNGGADWHVAVSGASAPPHAIDGTLDPGLAPLASCAGSELYADYDGRWLYVAAPAVSQSATRDHFVFVARTDDPARAAPWAKAGTVAAYDLLLGNEDSNNWCGWFDAAGTVLASGVASAAGTALEGRVDLQTRWGTAPASVRVGFAAYASPDGGALQAQSPCGDGDGDVEGGERAIVYSSAVLAAPAPPRPAMAPVIRLLSRHPVSSRLRVLVETPAPGPLRVELVDLQGRAVALLYEGNATGPVSVETNLDRGAGERRVAPGVYFLRARTRQGETVRRVVIVS